MSCTPQRREERAGVSVWSTESGPECRKPEKTDRLRGNFGTVNSGQEQKGKTLRLIQLRPNLSMF
jgi:hypothetical protein